MIKVQYIVDKNKSLFTIMFDAKVLDHLKAKCDDNLFFFQSLHNLKNLTLFKCDTGYRIKRVTRMKKTYQINSRYPINGMTECDFTECIYFLKKNGSIRIKLNFQ
jgi:hypothetical protein